MTTATEFQTKVTRAATNMDRLDLVVNGGPTDTAAIDGGQVPSIAKLLHDKSVDADSAIQSLTAFDPRGSWATGATYIRRDLVVQEGVVYIAVLDHIAMTSFASDLVAGKWAIFQGITLADLNNQVDLTRGSALVGYRGQTVRQALDGLGSTPLVLADGLTDASQACKDIDVLGPWRLKAGGLYRIGSSVTFNSPVVADGARFVIPNGVTVTFAGGISAGPQQIFNLSGTGAVAGLQTAHQAWFDGDMASLPGLPVSPTVCDAALQKAFDAIVPGGVLHGDARVRLKGGAQIKPGNASYDGHNIQFLWASSITNGFDITAGRPGFIRGFRFAPLVPGTIPTAGLAVLHGRTDCDLTDFEVIDAYAGVDMASGVSAQVQRFRIYGALLYGLRIRTIDVYASGGVIQALNDWIKLSNITGSFNLWDTITIGSSSGYVAAKYDGARYRMFFNDIMPAVGMTITSSSGGSATIADVTIGHREGAVRTEGNVEALCLSDMEVLGGLLSLVVSSYSLVAGRAGNLAFSTFSASVFFDTSYQGALVQGAYCCTWQSWFSNARAKNGVGFHTSFTMRNRIDARIVANSGYGGLVDTDCYLEDWTGTRFDGNCRNYAGDSSMAEMRVAGAAQRITMRSGSMGFAGSSGTTPPKGLWVDAAASDYLNFDGVQVGSVSWGSTGTHNKQP